MKPRVLLGALAILAGLVPLVLVLLPEEDVDPNPTPPGGTPEEPVTPDDPVELAGGTDRERGDGGRTAVDEPPDDDRTATPREPGSLPDIVEVAIHGRVLDLAGIPLAGAPVVASTAPRRPVAESDDAGRFTATVGIQNREVTLEVLSGHFATVRACVVRPRDIEREQILVATPAVALAGRVEEETGAAVPGARVQVSLPSDVLRTFPLPLDRASRPRHRTVADETGRFRLEHAPVVPGTDVFVSAEGYRTTTFSVPEVDREDLVFVLPPEEDALGGIVGTVLLARGQPAVGASVRYGPHDCVTDSEGGFSLPLDLDQPDHLALAAANDDQAMAVVQRFGEVLRIHAPYPPPPLTLVLEESNLSIAGRVVDDQGRGQPDWCVLRTTGTFLAEGHYPPRTAERLAGSPSESTTDEEGRFRLPHLLDRAYDLRAYHTGTLLTIERFDVRAGTEGLEIVVPFDALHESVTGRVVARDGTPLAGIEVSVIVEFSSDPSVTVRMSGAQDVTDEAGRFTLDGVPRQGALIGLEGETIVPGRVDGEEIAPDGTVEVEAARRVHFRLQPRGGDPADQSAELLDATGDPLPLHAFESGSWRSRSSIRLTAEGTGVWAVSEDAVWVRVRRGDETVLTLPLQLVPGEVNVIEVDLP